MEVGVIQRVGLFIERKDPKLIKYKKFFTQPVPSQILKNHPKGQQPLIPMWFEPPGSINI